MQLVFSINDIPRPKASRAVQPRIKTFHRKLRTGCFTCKRRRIRCDETQPCCMRCIRSKMKCEGYERTTPQTQAREIVTGKETLISSPIEQMIDRMESYSSNSMPRFACVNRAPFQWGFTEEQSRGFTFFHLQTLPTLTIFNESSAILFGDCIPFLAFEDPTIRSQVTALGLFHLGGSTEAPDALREYGQSLKFAIRSDTSDNIGALLRCLLFIMIEFNRGRFFQGMVHLRRGLEILTTTSCDGAQYRPDDPLCNVELFHVRKIFTDLAEAAGLINRFQSNMDRKMPDLNRPLKDFKDAQRISRQLARWTLTCGKDEEYVTRIWNKFHEAAGNLVGEDGHQFRLPLRVYSKAAYSNDGASSS